MTDSRFSIGRLRALALACCVLPALQVIAPLGAQERLGPPVPGDVSVGDGAAPDLSAPVAFEQLSNGVAFRGDLVDGLPHVSLWFAVAGGAAHDPDGSGGLAAVLATLAATAVGDSGALVSPSVLEGHWLVGVTVPAAAAGDLVDRLGALLAAPGEAFRDEALILARDRVLLRADDEAEVLPGPVLRATAQRLVAANFDWPRGAERPFAGRPADLEELSVEKIRAALAARLHPGALTVAVVAAQRPLLDRLRSALSDLPARNDVEPLETHAERAPMPAAERPHDLVDAPFVSLVIPAPRYGEDGFLPFLVGMEAARGRAIRTFQAQRGGELRAEFLPCAWDPLAGFRLAMLQRRGREGDSVDRVKSELSSLSAGLRRGGASPAEIAAAMGALMEQLRLPDAYDERVQERLRRWPRQLHMASRVALLYRLHGWPTGLRANLGAVPVTRVQRALARFLDPERVTWVTLTTKGG